MKTRLKQSNMQTKPLPLKRALRAALVVLLLSVAGMTKSQAQNITFADANVKALCVANWDTNGDGELSYAEAAAVTSLGEVFSNNTSITSFDELQYFIGLTSIGYSAFEGCTGLASIELPNSVTSIGYSAFEGCTGLASIELPNSVTYILHGAFSHCSSLASIELPNSVTFIIDGAFSYCTGLASMTVLAETPPTLDGSFGGVNKSIPVYVPCGSLAAYQNAYGWNEFTNIIGMCPGEVSVTVNPTEGGTVSGAGYYDGGDICVLTATPNPGFGLGNWTENGMVVSADMVYSFPAHPTTIIANFYSDSPIVFADADVKAICVANWDTNGDGELSYAEAAAVISLGDVFCNQFLITSFDELQYFVSLTSIGERAFYGCSGLASIEIPNSVTSIGDNAFRGCSDLTSIEIPNSVTSIGIGAFEYCSGLTSIEIPNSVTSIGSRPFYRSGLEQIIVDYGNMVYDSRENCNAIINSSTNELVAGCKNTVIPNSVTSIGDYAFFGCNGLASIEIPNSVTSIGDYAFSYCNGLASIEIPNSVTSIGFRVFEYTSLTSIEIPNSVTSIGRYAFYHCTDLTSIEIPNSVTSISKGAFANCYGLEQIIVDYGNMVYDSRENCNAIINSSTNELVAGCKNTVIPNSVTSIGDYAFFGCSGLTSIEIPNSVTSIGSSAFYNCSGLTSIEIPNSVTSIGESAFCYCTGLTSITVWAENPPTLDYYPFSGLIPLYVPCGSLATYQATVGWSDFTNIIGMCPGEVTVAVNPSEGGTVTGAGNYDGGDICVLAATPNPGFVFEQWAEDGETVSTDPSYSFRVTSDRALEARFAAFSNHWTPESSQYEDNMTFTCIVQLDGVEQRTTTLEVGAFCGEECRGSRCASHFAPTDRYIIQLTVFGEANDMIAFRLYDHQQQQELQLAPPAAVTFNTNGYGSLSEPYVLNFTSAITHTQALGSGWNWWSTYAEPDNGDGLSQLENSIGGAGIIIKSRDSGYVEAYEYNGETNWYGTLSSIANEQMYKIRTNAPCSATIVGYAADPSNHPISIGSGWNWIGYPYGEEVSVEEAMGGFTPESNDIIKGRDGYTTYYSDGSYNMWYGTLNTFEPGNGYMYRSNSSTPKTLVLQTGSGDGSEGNITPDGNVFRPAVEDYADNMTLTAVVELGGEELRSENYELATFVGDECRGGVRLMHVEPIDRYVAFLTVFGEGEEELHFRLADGTSSGLSSDRLPYAADGIVGSLDNPFTIHFGTLDVDESATARVKVYPNPSEGIFNIEGQGIRKVEVFNAFGQTVHSEETENGIVQLDLTNRAAGIYLVRILTADGILNQQIIRR